VSRPVVEHMPGIETKRYARSIVWNVAGLALYGGLLAVSLHHFITNFDEIGAVILLAFPTYAMSPFAFPIVRNLLSGQPLLVMDNRHLIVHSMFFWGAKTEWADIYAIGFSPSGLKVVIWLRDSAAITEKMSDFDRVLFRLGKGALWLAKPLFPHDAREFAAEIITRARLPESSVANHAW